MMRRVRLGALLLLACDGTRVFDQRVARKSFKVFATATAIGYVAVASLDTAYFLHSIDGNTCGVTAGEHERAEIGRNYACDWHP